ncbi:AEC family transporter [Advenella sp. RU8]|uniref:AEC family transporter n=1 Tax=Advenella sp. RU8 TaxID=3399575 RepID=UPI003AAF2572
MSRDDSQSTGPKTTVFDSIKNTIKEPIIWAPVLAFILLLADIRIPANIRSSMKLLSNATGGVALFASGIILFFSTVFSVLTICERRMYLVAKILTVRCRVGLMGNLIKTRSIKLPMWVYNQHSYFI